jgi:monoamine oxidase
VSGLCAGYELKKAGFDVTILEASSRVGGRVKTFRDPSFAPGNHGEGGAMRIPANHFLLHKYIEEFGLKRELFDFEMENKFIYISGYGETLVYDKKDSPTSKTFTTLLKSNGQTPDSKKLYDLFPGLGPDERGWTIDQLFSKAVKPVVDDFWAAYGKAPHRDKEPDTAKVVAAYSAITSKYDKYTLRSYLADVAGWSLDALNLFDLGNAHVVFENGFIESFKDAFLSSNDQGAQAGMQQLKPGMDAVPKGFISADRKESKKSEIERNHDRH